jgi:hypothetical protein
MLALIIFENKYVKTDNVDVYMQPFIEDLHILWIGVQSFDVFSK